MKKKESSNQKLRRENQFKLKLNCLTRLKQICKLICREHFIRKGHIPKNTNLENDLKIKLQKYYPMMCNYVQFNEQTQLNNSIEAFFNQGTDEEYFEIQVLIFSQRINPVKEAEESKNDECQWKFRKIQYPDGQIGYRHRHGKPKKNSGGSNQFKTSFASNNTSFDEQDFSQLNQEGDDKFKDIFGIRTNESHSIGQTTQESIQNNPFLLEHETTSSQQIQLTSTFSIHTLLFHPHDLLGQLELLSSQMPVKSD